MSSISVADNPTGTLPEKVFYPRGDGKPMGETDKHVALITESIAVLRLYFQERQNEVYIAGNNFIYFEEGNPKKRVSPDTYLVFGVEMRLRDRYFVWQEDGHTPNVVFEFTSWGTRREDLNSKFALYEQTLKVDEYFLFDPKGEYLAPRLQGYRRIDGQYVPLELTDGRLYSEKMGLYLVPQGMAMRFQNPLTGELLPNLRELALQKQKQTHEERAEYEARRADYEAQRADDEARFAKEEAQRAADVLARVVELEAEIARMRGERMITP